MTTTKSFSNLRGGLFASALRAQLGFAIASFIFLFIAMVVPFLVSAPSHNSGWSIARDASVYELEQMIANFYANAFSYGVYFDPSQTGLIAVILSFFAFACALSSAKYMHSMKMSDLYHALPVRREKLMLTNLAASAIAVLGPLLVLTVGTMLGILIVYGRYGWVGGWFFSVILADFLAIAAVSFVMYAFATFIAVQVGTTFDAFALTGLLGFLPTAVYLIGGAIWQSTVYGAVFSADYALRLSPFLFYFEIFRVRSLPIAAHSVWGALPVFLAWTAIGVGLLYAATLLYKRRKSELAGTTQPEGRLQMIAKFFSAFCGGAIFLAIFNDYPLAGRMFVILLATVAIGLIAELILARGVRSMKRNIKWLALAGLVYSLLYLGATMDILNHAQRIPASNSIVAVSIDYRGRFENENHPSWVMPGQAWNVTRPLTEPESIEIVREVHRRAVEDHFAERQEWANITGVSSYNFMGFATRWSSNNIHIRYQLSNGRTFERRYPSMNSDTFRLLTGLEAQPDFIAANHPIFFMEDYRQVTNRGPIEIEAILISLTGGPSRSTLSGEQAERLARALREDMLRETLDEVRRPVHPTLGFVTLNYNEARQQPQDRRWHIVTTQVPITAGYTSTLAVLEGLGAADILRPDFAEVHEILVIDFVDGLSFGHRGERVVNLSVGNRHVTDLRMILEDQRDHPESWDNRQVFSITNPDEIANLMTRVHTTLLLDDEIIGRAVYLQAYGSYDRSLFAGYVLIEDLPVSIRSQVADHLNERIAVRDAHPAQAQR
ncbi:MAG: hypothetical protein FWE32_01025 [Oscillospiraceae bacterium]|nr:hypothetical protein [Oscillospiraceae bacterium]